MYLCICICKCTEIATVCVCLCVCVSVLLLVGCLGLAGLVACAGWLLQLVGWLAGWLVRLLARCYLTARRAALLSVLYQFLFRIISNDVRCGWAKEAARAASRYLISVSQSASKQANVYMCVCVGYRYESKRRVRLRLRLRIGLLGRRTGGQIGLQIDATGRLANER